MKNVFVIIKSVFATLRFFVGAFKLNKNMDFKQKWKFALDFSKFAFVCFLAQYKHQANIY